MKINKNAWRPSRGETMTGLAYEQAFELEGRAEDYPGGWHPECGRRREMELFEAVVATLFSYRHNCSQEVIGAVFGASQATVSRMIALVEEPIAAVLNCEVPGLVEVISGRVVIGEDTLIPIRNRAAVTELYSGKCHRSGAAVQVRAGTGRPRHVGEPLAGCTHDVTAFRETGLAAVLEEHMHENLVIANLATSAKASALP
jgi:hypothetical protein